MRTISAGLLVLGFFVTAAWSDSPKQGLHQEKDNKTDNTENKRKPKFTISKETTYLTEPRDKDGYIDYAAALNRRLRQGVTPANNANVLLWQALGPHPEGMKVPAEFFQLMGVGAPPEQGDYFIGLLQYIEEHRKVNRSQAFTESEDLLDRTTQRPWTPQQYPRVAAWLKANAKPLALVVEATKRPQFFSPLVAGKLSAGLISALTYAHLGRELAKALTARAMLHVGQGRHDDAWQELLACHRLGRLVGRGGTLTGSSDGIGIDGLASKADLAFLDGAKLSAKRAKDCLSDLQQLPPMPEIAAQVDLNERFLFLNSIMMVERWGIQYIRLFKGLSGDLPSKAPDPKERQVLDLIDWNPVLRSGNLWFDRAVATLRVKDQGVRAKRLGLIKNDIIKLSIAAVDSLREAKGLPAKEASKVMGKAVGDDLMSDLVMSAVAMQRAADRNEQVRANLYVAFALAAYQRDHGSYPGKLEALAPKYLPNVPQDLFSGKPLIYRPSENGYLLYSVGVNGKDEEGRGYDDDPRGDDLSVRMPLPKPHKK